MWEAAYEKADITALFRHAQASLCPSCRPWGLDTMGDGGAPGARWGKTPNGCFCRRSFVTFAAIPTGRWRVGCLPASPWQRLLAYHTTNAASLSNQHPSNHSSNVSSFNLNHKMPERVSNPGR